MKIRYLFLIILLSFLTPDISQSQWQWQNPIPQGNTLNDVFFIDETTGWAVGDAGTIMKSTDGGLSYDLINFSTHENFSAVEFFDENSGLVAGSSGLILITSDGGTGWSQVDVGITGNFTEMCFSDSNTAWLITDDGIILKSMDYGDSWQVAYSSNSMKFSSISFVDEDYGWVAGFIETNIAGIVRTIDGGVSWTVMELPLWYPIVDICFVDSLIGFATCADYEDFKNLAKTADGGETWQFILDDIYYGEFYDIVFTDPDHGWLAGSSATVPTSHGILYYTDDGGTTWYPGENLGIDNLFDFNAVYFINDQTGWMVGSLGNILYSTDGGVYWTKINPESNGYSTLEDVFFIDDLNGWAAGASFYPFESRIFHTTDGGNSWNAQPFLDHMLNSIFFIDPFEGWITGGRSLHDYSTAIYHTSDGGEIWEKQFSENLSNGDFSDVYFKDIDHGWVVGDGGNQYPPENISLFYYTDDGGENWTDQSYLFSHALSSICFTDDETGFIAGHKTILRSIDGGDNWTEIWTGPHYLRDIFFTDEQHGWAIGDSATRYPYRDVIMRTADGGVTWEEQFPGLSSRKKQLFFTDNTHGWIARDEGDILFTVDGGITWHHMFVNFNGTFGGVFLTDIDNGWAVGSEEAIFHIDNGSIVSVEENGYKTQCSDLQVHTFPNPFRDRTTLEFVIPRDTEVSLKIFDFYGKEIRKKDLGRLGKGEHRYTLYQSNLQAGVYIFILTAGKDMETGKILIF